MPPDRTPFPKSAFEALALAEARSFVLEGIHQEYPETILSGTESFDKGLMHVRRHVPSASLEKLEARAMNDAERFDGIGAFDVIEHIDEDEQVLANLSRAPHKDGQLLQTAPQHRWLWLARQRPGQKNAEVNSELDISDRTNRLLEFVMKIEFGLLKAGITFPLGGSLLLLAKKR
ncbi:hypothetical protein [Pseudomonas sp. Pseusp3]|uniref:hypothetical protein n=1 Tax=unclassified Pseudomonas TaxID=196821 RepID=UPI0039AF246A